MDARHPGCPEAVRGGGAATRTTGRGWRGRRFKGRPRRYPGIQDVGMSAAEPSGLPLPVHSAAAECGGQRHAGQAPAGGSVGTWRPAVHLPRGEVRDPGGCTEVDCQQWQSYSRGCQAFRRLPTLPRSAQARRGAPALAFPVPLLELIVPCRPPRRAQG